MCDVRRCEQCQEHAMGAEGVGARRHPLSEAGPVCGEREEGSRCKTH